MSLKLNSLLCGYEFPGTSQLESQILPSTGVIVVLGANGSGKSTILKTLCGLLSPLSGEVTLNEQALHTIPYGRRPLWISTEFDWEPQLTPNDIFELYDTPTSDVRAFLERELNVESLLYRRLGEISSGEKRRVALVLALAHASPVIVMDEPTNFLEYRARVRVAHLLGKLAGRKLVIFSTHEVEWLTYFPNATCWVLNRSKEIHVLKNPDELVENTRLEPIFGGVFRAVSVTDARSSSPSRKILYFEESASSAIRAPL